LNNPSGFEFLHEILT